MHHLNQSCNRSVEKFIAPISCLFPIVDWFTVANVVALVGWWEGKSQCRSDCTFLTVLIDYIVNENAIQIHFHYIAIGTFSDPALALFPAQQPIKAQQTLVRYTESDTHVF